VVSKTETIVLGQFLKVMGWVATGGEAKLLIQEGQVQVNGQVETRRRKQLSAGDKVTLGGRTFVVQLDPVDAVPVQEADTPGS
jgi:ribosome-associated protein